VTYCPRRRLTNRYVYTSFKGRFSRDALKRAPVFFPVIVLECSIGGLYGTEGYRWQQPQLPATDLDKWRMAPASRCSTSSNRIAPIRWGTDKTIYKGAIGNVRTLTRTPTSRSTGIQVMNEEQKKGHSYCVGMQSGCSNSTARLRQGPIPGSPASRQDPPRGQPD